MTDDELRAKEHEIKTFFGGLGRDERKTGSNGCAANAKVRTQLDAGLLAELDRPWLRAALQYEPHRKINMTRSQLRELVEFFREREKLAERMKEEAERKYREEHGLREPTARDIALWEQGKARKGAGWDNDDGIAWNYPPEIYARMNEVCFTRVPKRIWNILGRPANLYETDEEYLQIAFNPKF